jgi:hypothetical protein
MLRISYTARLSRSYERGGLVGDVFRNAIDGQLDTL